MMESPTAIARDLAVLLSGGFIKSWAWLPEDRKYHVVTQGGGVLRMTPLATQIFCEKARRPTYVKTAREVADQRWGMMTVKSSAKYL